MATVVKISTDRFDIKIWHFLFCLLFYYCHSSLDLLYVLDILEDCSLNTYFTAFLRHT